MRIQVLANELAPRLSKPVEIVVEQINALVATLQDQSHPLFTKRGVLVDLNAAQVAEVRDRLFAVEQRAQQPSNPAAEPQSQPGNQGTPGGVFGEIYADYRAMGQRASVQIASVVANQAAADVGVLLQTCNRAQLGDLAAQYNLGSTDYTGEIANDFFGQLQGFQVQMNARPTALQGATVNLLAASMPTSSNPTTQSESSDETTESLG